MPSEMRVHIAHRFHGPAGSGNGGYTCGLTAQALDVRGASVRLLRPPPLERPLELSVDGDTARLLDGDDVVATAVRPDFTLMPPPAEPIGFDEAEAAAKSFDVEAYHAQHPFPSCLTCGPARKPGEGLRIFPGRTERPHTVAWPWIPDESLRGVGGAIDPLFMWAALDCPSGHGWYHDPEPVGRHVLGELTAQIRGLPEPGQQTVAAGWLHSVDGRKRHSGSAVWSADGELLARASATWVKLTEEQFAQFAVAGA
jgi:hypothetical protein